MNVLVTGARGFLGRRVVLALRRRGHHVRAVDRTRSGRQAEELAAEGIEQLWADLCAAPDLATSLAGVQAVIHLAAEMRGDTLVEATMRGTRRLLDAIEQASVRHIVLASSLSVYDWSAVEGVLDESSPLEEHPEGRDPYTVAKIEQERMVFARCLRSGVALTVLRPGLLWGSGRDYPAIIGPRVGPVRVVIGSSRQLPIVHVENCADAFAAAIDAGPTAAGTFNVIDHPTLTARQFAQDQRERSGHFGVTLSVGYRLGLATVKVVHRLTPRALRRRLPSMAAPRRFAARYKPVRIEGAKFREVVRWRPPLSYEGCLDRTFPE